MQNPQKQLNFLSFILKFRDVERFISVPGKRSGENDVEHSYQLAMFAWYLVTSDKLPLDVNKVIKYAMVHDLAETYAGDVHIFSDQTLKDTKEKREKDALEKINHEFPEFEDLHEIISEYESRESEEAKFVYALDKIIGDMNVYLDGNKHNVEKGVTLKMIRDLKDKKIAVSKYVDKYWQDFLPLRQAIEDSTMNRHD